MHGWWGWWGGVESLTCLPVDHCLGVGGGWGGLQNLVHLECRRDQVECLPGHLSVQPLQLFLEF